MRRENRRQKTGSKIENKEVVMVGSVGKGENSHSGQDEMLLFVLFSFFSFYRFNIPLGAHPLFDAGQTGCWVPHALC